MDETAAGFGKERSGGSERSFLRSHLSVSAPGFLPSGFGPGEFTRRLGQVDGTGSMSLPHIECRVNNTFVRGAAGGCGRVTNLVFFNLEHMMSGEKRRGPNVRRAKGEGSLLKVRGCRFWYAQHVHNGKQVRVSTRTEKKMEALAFLRKLMGDRDEGRAPMTNARKLFYADLRRGLLDNYVERGNKSLRTTASGEDSVIGLKPLDTFFGYGADKPGPTVGTINTETSRAFARQRLAEGAGNATINRSLACLRRMLHIAHEDGRIHFVPKIRLLKEPPARHGFLELEKFEELVALLPTHLKPLIIFLYWCGVRVGEALQIEWEQVDLDARLIQLEEEQTKNAEARVVPLPAILVMMLKEVTPKVGRVFDGTNLRVEWQEACAACGLGTRELVKPKEGYKWYRYRGLIVHDLRRSAVRNLVNAGVPERVAMKISGHKTRAVFDRYHIVNADDVTRAMQRVELTGVATSERLVKKPAEAVRRLHVSHTK